MSHKSGHENISPNDIKLRRRSKVTIWILSKSRLNRNVTTDEDSIHLCLLEWGIS